MRNDPLNQMINFFFKATDKPSCQINQILSDDRNCDDWGKD